MKTIVTGFLLYMIFQKHKGIFGKSTTYTCPGNTRTFPSSGWCQVQDSIPVCVGKDETKTVFGGEKYKQHNNGVTQWTFYSPDPDDVITLTFEDFDLGGAICGQNNSVQYPMVLMKSSPNVILPPYCTGRPPSLKSNFSSQQFISVTLCNGRPETKFSFTVRADKNWSLMPNSQNQTVEIKSRRDGEVNWIMLEERSGLNDVMMSIDKVDIKPSRPNSKSCKVGYISVKDAQTDLNLLKGSKPFLCNTTKLPWKHPRVIRASASKIKITHKNSKFRLTFWLVKKTAPTSEDVLEEEESTTLPQEEDQNSVVKERSQTEKGDKENPSLYFIGIGFAGLLILVVILAVVGVCYYRRKDGKTKRQAAIYEKPSSQLEGNVRFCSGRPDESVVSNAMYDRVLSSDDGLPPHRDTPQLSGQRPLLGIDQKYTGVKNGRPKQKNKEDLKKRNSFNRPPQPLPRGKTRAKANMYESIEEATYTKGLGTVPSSQYMSSSTSIDSDLSDVKYDSRYTQDDVRIKVLSKSKKYPKPKMSISDSMPNMTDSMYEDDTASYLGNSGYKQPRPSVPNIFIASAYCSSQDLHNSLDSSGLQLPTSGRQTAASDDSMYMKSALSHSFDSITPSLDVSQSNLLPSGYYDSPRPSLANAFVANGSNNNNKTIANNNINNNFIIPSTLL